MPIIPVNYKNSNTTLGFSSADLSNILMRREYFSTGGLYTWGTNLDFGLGDGTASTTSRSSPNTTVGGGQVAWEWIDIKARTGAGIKMDGTLWTWGRGTYGVLGAGGTAVTSRSSPLTTSTGGTNWDEVSTSTAHMVAVKNDGTLWTWGRNNAGQLGTATTTSRSSPGTTAGGSSISDAWKTPMAGGDTSGCIKNDGTLWMWGRNNEGMLGDGSTTNRSSPVTTSGGGTNWTVISIANDASGVGFAAGIKADGTLWTWGNNSRFQLGDGTTTARSSPFTTAGGGTTWKQVSCGTDHAVAVKFDGTLWTWGANNAGETGNGAVETSRSSPKTTAGGGTSWKYVNASHQCTGAIKSDGTLWTWGRNVSGELGVGDTTNRSSPVQVTGSLLNWKMICLGGASTNGSSSGIVETETFFPDITVYTTPGTFSHSILEGKQSAFMEVWGGGGGGGDGYTTLPITGGAGGVGGYARSYLDVKFQVGKTMNVVVGSGGAAGGGTGSGGADGSPSSITGNTYSMTTITGGQGGGGQVCDPGLSQSGNPGTTGSGSGGTDYNSSGVASRTGRNGLIYGTSGAGGPGGAGGGASYTAGTNGGNGAVIITYF